MWPVMLFFYRIGLVTSLILYETASGSAAERLCEEPEVIFCEDFERGTLDQWQAGYKPDLHAITSDPANTFAGGRALEVTYPQGGEGKWLARWFMPGYDRAFVRLYIKFEEGFRCGINCTKIVAFYGNRLDDSQSGFGKAGIRPTGTDFFFASLVTLNWRRRPDPGEIIFYSYFPDMTQAPDGMFWGNFFFQEEPREAVQPGRWYCLELEVKANQPGLRDGYQRMWINDIFKGDTTGMRWRDTTDVRINAVQLTFSASPVPIREHVWIDNLVVSTERIGCTVSP
ncbi:MAG TPA: hypothetical protein VHF07_08035 [Nitrospiraceae bacterium]|nr:hypothetical protein [Nitrospiraceae bacterium]